MSEMFATTGRQRIEPCGKCGTDVTKQESAGLYTGKIIWTAERHRAPCGAYCFGAGVPPKEYRLRALHGHSDYPCPMCGADTGGKP